MKLESLCGIAASIFLNRRASSNEYACGYALDRNVTSAWSLCCSEDALT